MIIITNNPKVFTTINQPVEYIEGSYFDVLETVKKSVIEDKAIILSHPLSGSIKPNETYYKSIMLDDKEHEYIDLDSLELIEQAMIVYEKFIKDKQRPNWSPTVLDDFAQIDYFLINSAIESANRL